MATVNRDALVWGLVGGLSFLVLVTGYELASGWRAGLAVKLGVALVVTGLAAGASAVFARRLRRNESA